MIEVRHAEPRPPLISHGRSSASPEYAGARPLADSRERRIPSLDGVRAVAFLAVFVAHLGYEKVIPGGFGVTTFFFLSGFLITTLLRKEAEQAGSISIGRFYVRRVLRIVPPFLFALALSSAVTVALGGDLRLRMIGIELAQLTNYAIAAGHEAGKPLGSGVIWSLAVEEHFYLVFPLVYVGLRAKVASPRRRVAILLALCLSALAWRCVLVIGTGAGASRTYFTTDTRFDSILFGCVLAELRNPALDQLWLEERHWKRILFPAAIVVLLATFLIRDPTFRETIRYTIQGLALIPIFVVIVRYPGWGALRLLNGRIVSWLAERSYTLYLVHYTVILAAEKLMGVDGLLAGAVALPLSLLIAQCIYVAVERPCARLRNRLLHA